MSFAAKLGTWGKRAQIGGAIDELADLKGNRDQLWANEDLPSGTTTDFYEQDPILLATKLFVEVGFSVNDEKKELTEYLAAKEKEWGRPVLDLPKSALKNGQLFAVQKAFALDRLQRHPDDVIDLFVEAEGKIHGRTVKPRKIFCQHFKAIGEKSGHLIVVSPGFNETGRDYYEQIQKMNFYGHDVLVMDHQWAGLTEDSSGSFDSGFSVTRDVAAVTAQAAKILENDLDLNTITLFGNSMGAGAGIISALALNDSDKIDLENGDMPKELNAVLNSPFLGTTDSISNQFLEFLARVPVIKSRQIRMTNLLDISQDRKMLQLDAQRSIQCDIEAQPSSAIRAREDLDMVKELFKNGHLPRGKIEIIHSEEDTLADSTPIRGLQKLLKKHLNVTWIEGDKHHLSSLPSMQKLSLDILEELLVRKDTDSDTDTDTDTDTDKDK